MIVGDLLPPGTIECPGGHFLLGEDERAIRRLYGHYMTTCRRCKPHAIYLFVCTLDMGGLTVRIPLSPTDWAALYRLPTDAPTSDYLTILEALHPPTQQEAA